MNFEQETARDKERKACETMHAKYLKGEEQVIPPGCTQFRRYEPVDHSK